MDEVGGTTQVAMRAELNRRGLINYGTTQELKERIEKDNARGTFKGSLADMSEEYLREGCQLLSIPCREKKPRLIKRIRKYNAYKRQQREHVEPEGSFNAGLPTPDDRLGKPINEKILGTRGSLIYSKAYVKYLQKHKAENKTTENALTLRYWLYLRYPHIPRENLWPIQRYDGRID